MGTRIYLVTELTEEGANEYLVEAGTPSQAIGFKVKGKYAAEAAKTPDVARLMGAGVVVEKAKADEVTSD